MTHHNEDPMDDGQSPFSFFPVPPEVVQAAQRQQDMRIMQYQDQQIEQRTFIESLSVDDLMTLKDIIRTAENGPAVGEYLVGYINALITYDRKRCAGCGKDHLGSLLDDSEAHAALYPEDEDDEENGRKLASERDDLIASGVDPSELTVPVNPVDMEAVKRLADMEKYNVYKPFVEVDTVRCKGCGLEYVSLEDRMIKEPDDCQGCHHKSAWGGK